MVEADIARIEIQSVVVSFCRFASPYFSLEVYVVFRRIKVNSLYYDFILTSFFISHYHYIIGNFI